SSLCRSSRRASAERPSSSGASRCFELSIGRTAAGLLFCVRISVFPFRLSGIRPERSGDWLVSPPTRLHAYAGFEPGAPHPRPLSHPLPSAGRGAPPPTQKGKTRGNLLWASPSPGGGEGMGEGDRPFPPGSLSLGERVGEREIGSIGAPNIPSCRRAASDIIEGFQT